MSYSESLAGSIIVIDLGADGALKAANIERRYVATFNGSALPDRLDRAVLSAADLATVLPDQAALMARVVALEAERDTAVTDGRAAATAADETVAALTAERDRLAATVTALAGAVDVVNGVPQTVPAYQARAALLSAGLLDAVEAAVAGADRQVQIAWEYATTVRRQSPFISAMQGALGLDDAAIDALFVAAAAVA